MLNKFGLFDPQQFPATFFSHYLQPKLTALRIHNKIVALYAALVIFSRHFLFNTPEMPMLVKALLIDIAFNPRHPTLLPGMLPVNHSLDILLPEVRIWQSFLSCVDSMFSSHGTESSHIITFFVEFQYIIIPGRSFVSAICAGNFVCLSRSTKNCQSGAEYNIATLLLDWGCFVLPTLTKLILCLLGLNLFNFIAPDTTSAIALRTRSCCQR